MPGPPVRLDWCPLKPAGRSKKEERRPARPLPGLLLIARFSESTSELLALNIDAQRDVIVTWQDLDRYCLRAAVGQCTAIQIHGADCTSGLIENHDLMDTVFGGLHVSLVVDVQVQVVIPILVVGRPVGVDPRDPKSIDEIPVAVLEPGIDLADMGNFNFEVVGFAIRRNEPELPRTVV
jgi:hypothetical protein